MNKQPKTRRGQPNAKRLQRRKNESKAKMEASIRKALAKELLSVSFSFLGRHGFLARELGDLARECLKKPSGFSASTITMRDIACLSRLMNEWTENARYIDTAGRPRVLEIEGESISFAELAAKHFRNRSVTSVLKFAIKFKAVEPIGRQHVAQLGSCVLLTGNRTLLLGHAVRAVRGFLATSEYNGRRMQAAPWPERQAFTELPQEKFGEFLRFMREPIINLVDMGNRWLMANAVHQPNQLLKHKEEKKIFAGVHAYVFRDT